MDDITEELRVVMSSDDDGEKITAVENINSHEVFKLFSSMKINLPESEYTVQMKTHNIFMLCTGDLVFLSTMLGKEGMAAHHCIYCMMSRKDWKYNSVNHSDAVLWTQDSLKHAYEEYSTKRLHSKTLHGVHGVNNVPLWGYAPSDMSTVRF